MMVLQLLSSGCSFSDRIKLFFALYLFTKVAGVSPSLPIPGLLVIYVLVCGS